jgi:3-hydroxyisobutyrate dehydrogenase-like beta-hydroxyacid dehydrogenase
VDRRAIGMVGLGLLGSALAERFLSSGRPVVGFDLNADRRRELAARGGRAAGSAAEVVRACGRVVLSLPDSAVVEAVLDEAAADLRAGLVVTDTTTGDPVRAEAIGSRLAGRSVAYVDATVLGSSAEVRSAAAVAMVGGERADCEGCADLFACFAREWFYLGPWGSGSRMKLVVNLVLGLNRAVLAEGLAFARACGLDPAEALRVLQSGAAYSRVMDAKGPMMVGALSVEGGAQNAPRPTLHSPLSTFLTPQARLSQHLKDVGLILAEAERVGAAVPLSELHRKLLECVQAAGLGDADNAAVIAAFGRLSQGPPAAANAD